MELFSPLVFDVATRFDLTKLLVQGICEESVEPDVVMGMALMASQISVQEADGPASHEAQE